MENLLEKNKRLIHSCADKLCKKYTCQNLKEDLISVGNVVLLDKANDYNDSLGTNFSTFIYPYLLGTMKREIERFKYPVHISKDDFKKYAGLLKTAFVDLESILEWKLSHQNVEKEVLTKIYIEYIFEEFEKLTFKEKQIIGGFYGVFGYQKQTIADIAEEFQMKENAVQKAKDNAVEKLSYNCFRGKFDIYRQAVAKIRKATKDGRN